MCFQSELEPLIMRRKRVTECSEHPCSTLPCDNQGSCAADDQGFVCSCKNNFAGIEERLRLFARKVLTIKIWTFFLFETDYVYVKITFEIVSRPHSFFLYLIWNRLAKVCCFRVRLLFMLLIWKSLSTIIVKSSCQKIQTRTNTEKEKYKSRGQTVRIWCFSFWL